MVGHMTPGSLDLIVRSLGATTFPSHLSYQPVSLCGCNLRSIRIKGQESVCILGLRLLYCFEEKSLLHDYLGYIIV